MKMLDSQREIIENWQIIEGNGLNKFVSVDKEAAVKYAQELKQKGKKIEPWHFPEVHPENDMSYAAMVLVSSAVNFCFPIFENLPDKFSVENPINPQRPFQGSVAMSHCFWRAFGERILTAEKLKWRFATLEKTSEFFKGTNRIPLLEHRHWIMQEVVQVLEERYEGNPLNIYEEADWDAPELIRNLVSCFPQAFGDDVSPIYIGATNFYFRFYKKAKLVALLYQGRALQKGSKLKPLSGLHHIIAVEDYQIPRFLQHKKVLNYKKNLLEKIENYKIIRRHEQAEVEIRAGSTFANSYILEELNRGLEPGHSDYWDVLPLDSVEWLGGRKIEFPHHLTPTTAY